MFFVRARLIECCAFFNANCIRKTTYNLSVDISGRNVIFPGWVWGGPRLAYVFIRICDFTVVFSLGFVTRTPTGIISVNTYVKLLSETWCFVIERRKRNYLSFNRWVFLESETRGKGSRDKLKPPLYVFVRNKKHLARSPFERKTLVNCKNHEKPYLCS